LIIAQDNDKSNPRFQLSSKECLRQKRLTRELCG